MPEGVDAASFEFNEGIRIIIPGAVAVALADGIVRTATANSHGLGLGAFAAVVASVLVGLLFYFADIPAKATVFSDGLPTDKLKSWGEPRDRVSAVNLYFVMLDTEIPAGIKVRATYMGSMYRIGYESTGLLIFASALVLGQGFWSSRSIDADSSAVPTPAKVAIVVGLAMLVFAWHASRMTQARRVRSNRAPGRMDGTAHDGLAVAVAAAVLGATLLGSEKWDIARWTLLLPGTSVLLLWAYRYFKGYAGKPEDHLATRLGRFIGQWAGSSFRSLPSPEVATRTSASALQAARILIASNSLMLVAFIGASPYAGWLDRTEFVVWLAVQGAGVALVIARGHERRLSGGYATQRNWMTLNKTRLMKDYFEDSGSGSPAP